MADRADVNTISLDSSLGYVMPGIDWFTKK